MTPVTKEYQDLNCALDDVRHLCAEWAAMHDAPPFGDDIFRYVRLVLYEWIANLHQHGQFDGRTPVVRIRLTTKDQHVYCEVEDNSAGFDLAGNLPTDPPPSSETLPERGMGLRIIDACTHHLSYDRVDDGHCRFAFSIPPDHDPWLTMRF